MPDIGASLNIGEYKITVLNTGRFSLDGGAMFGVVPKVLWAQIIVPDDLNRIPLALNSLLIEYKNEKCLVDTGIGYKMSPKYREIYNLQNGGSIVETLDYAGFKVKEITKVFFTHLHFDHAGGATQYDNLKKPVPVFENAEYYVHKGEWEEAVKTGAKSSASYINDDFMPLEQSGRLNLLEGNINEVLPGLFLKVTGGHTMYHQAVILDVEDAGFVYPGDLIPTSHHLKIPYVMAYDLYPVETMKIKNKLLHEACYKNWLLFFEHDLHVPVCRLAYNDLKKVFYPVNMDAPIG